MIAINEKRLKTITLLSTWVVVIVGGIFGILLTIIGYLTGSGPGGGMAGPLWKILITGLVSLMAGALTGAILERILARIILKGTYLRLEFMVRSFAIVLAGSLVAFVVSWEAGYLVGKITGAIEGLDWIEVLFYTPLMSLIYGIPVSLIAALVHGMVVFFCLKVGG